MPISKDNKSNNKSRRVYNTRSGKLEKNLKKNELEGLMTECDFCVLERFRTQNI